MRLSLLFLLAIIFIPTLVSSQNEVSNPEKVKIPKEVGVNFGRYIRGEYGFNGFFKIRRKQLEPTRKGRETQKNYRFSGGFFLNKPADYLYKDNSISSSGSNQFTNFKYNQNEATVYLMMGLERNYIKKKSSYWFGFQVGPYYKKYAYSSMSQSFIDGILQRERSSVTTGSALGWLIDSNFGYKYALTKHLNLGIELNFWMTAVYDKQIAVYNDGTVFDYNIYDIDGKFLLFPRSLFISYYF
jgi:hypothetical protein